MIPEDETVPNDYIRNGNPQIRQLALSAAAPCFDPGPCVTTVGVDADQWIGLIGGGEPDGWTWYGGGVLPFWLILRGGEIVQIFEQYLP